jgi:hypothetical protein
MKIPAFQLTFHIEPTAGRLVAGSSARAGEEISARRASIQKAFRNLWLKSKRRLQERKTS